MGFIKKNNGTGGGTGSNVNVEDNLNSTSTTDALSANQGKILNEKIDEKAPIDSPDFTTDIAMGRKTGSTIGSKSVATGNNVEASGSYSHAEGDNTVASGASAHAEGGYTAASGGYSHAEGRSTKASSPYQHVEGKYNIEDTTQTYAHIVGNGTTAGRSNAHTLDWNGNAWYAGNVSVNGTPTNPKDLVTKEYMDGLVGEGVEASLIPIEERLTNNEMKDEQRDMLIQNILDGDNNNKIKVEGDNSVQTTYSTDNGLTIVNSIEGETLVNVCNQEEPIAITKSYTVENTNHVALQGEYDGKARPVVQGKTLVNIHPKVVLAKLQTGEIESGSNIYNTTVEDNYIKISATNLAESSYRYINMGKIQFEMFKPNTTYTLAFTKLKGVNKICLQDGSSQNAITDYFTAQDNQLAYTFITKETLEKSDQILYLWLNPSLTTIDTEVENPMIFEGDLTAPPQDYIEGLKSSFEDGLITDENDPNYGKYKVDYKVTGKNKFDINTMLTVLWVGIDGDLCDDEDGILYSAIIPILNDKTYYITNTGNRDRYVLLDENMNILRFAQSTNNKTVTNDINAKYLLYYPNSGSSNDVFNTLQIEEGTVATDYEPYKEYTKTFYLNSPLLEGDTIQDIDGKATHVHRSEIRTYQTDDELTYPTDMTNTLITKSSPTYETISEESILCDSYVNGHLDFDSAVPVEKVVFMEWGQILKYVYPSTTYTIQFESDNVGKLNELYFTNSIVNKDVVKGLNKFTITTSNTFNATALIFNGIGFNASNISVVATELDFNYFKGLQSSFEDKVNEDGKYEVNVKITNEEGKEFTATVLLNSPLCKEDTIEVVNGHLAHVHTKEYRDYIDGDYGTYETDGVTTLIPLAESIVEDIEPIQPMLILQSIKNGTLSIDTIIPAKLNVEYTCNTLSYTPIVDGTLTLTTYKYQTTDMIDETTITLPTVTSYTELHLFFAASADLTLIIPDVKFETVPQVLTGKTYDFTFIYIDETIGWLCKWIQYE